jgi:hypothetical protein
MSKGADRQNALKQVKTVAAASELGHAVTIFSPISGAWVPRGKQQAPSRAIGRRPMKTSGLLIALALCLAGCGTAQFGQPPGQTGPVQGIWLRSDGQSGRNNPALAAQFETDKAECTAGGSEPDRVCMAHRGYVLVPEDQVEQAAAKLRAARNVN